MKCKKGGNNEEKFLCNWLCMYVAFAKWHVSWHEEFCEAEKKIVVGAIFFTTSTIFTKALIHQYEYWEEKNGLQFFFIY